MLLAKIEVGKPGANQCVLDNLEQRGAVCSREAQAIANVARWDEENPEREKP